MDLHLPFHLSLERRFTLSVDGSHEGAQNLTLSRWFCPADPARFHYIKYNQTDLDVELARRLLCGAAVCYSWSSSRDWVALSVTELVGEEEAIGIFFSL